jgi:iron complex outermembrane receptor protein
MVGRYVDALPALRVPSYTELDMRLGWRPRPDFEVALVGQNLLRHSHLEYPSGGAAAGEVERSVYGKLAWRR